MKGRKEEGDSFYVNIVAPRLRKVEGDLKKEIEFAFDLARKVANTSDREAFRKMEREISAGWEKTKGGQDANHLYENLVGVVAEKNGPNPFIARILAVSNIGRLAFENRIELSRADRLGQMLNEAIRTEPVLRGPLLLQAALEAAIGRQSRGGKGWLAGWDPDPQSEGEMNRWRREGMVEHAVGMFSVPDFSLLLPDWRVAFDNLSVGEGLLAGDVMVPDRVMKLNELERMVTVESPELGYAYTRRELKAHICSLRAQSIAATWGVPVGGKFRSGVLEPRGLSLVRGIPLVRGDDDALRYEGVQIDPVWPYTAGGLEEMKEKFGRFRGCLPWREARNLVQPDVLTYLVSIRALRRSKRRPIGERFRAIGRDVGLAIGDLKVPVKMKIVSEGQVIEERETSILTAHLEEYRRKRGKLVGRSLTEDEMEESVYWGAMAAVCGAEPDSGYPVLRPEKEVMTLFNERISAVAISVEDAKSRPELVNRKRFSVETIRRKTVLAEANIRVSTGPYSDEQD